MVRIVMTEFRQGWFCRHPLEAGVEYDLEPEIADYLVNQRHVAEFVVKPVTEDASSADEAEVDASEAESKPKRRARSK